MKAWPAADEEKTDGVIDAVIGVAALVTALILGAHPLWLLVPAVVFAVLARGSQRGTLRLLEQSHPAPPEFTVHRRAAVIARHLPEPVAFAALMLAVVWSSAQPGYLGLFAVLSLFGAATAFKRARMIERWQAGHGGRVVRTRNDLWIAH